MDGIKGWPAPNALDIDGNITSNVNLNSTGAIVFSGCCVHVAAVTASGLGTGTTNNVPIAGFEMGAKTGQMPIFLWVGQDGYDVQNPGVSSGFLGGSGGVSGTPGSGTVPAWVPIRPTGKVMGLVATGGYELETTEFDTTQTYAVNDLLRTVTSNTDANGGKMTNQDASGGQAFATSSKLTLYTDSAVGVVSRGTYVNKNGKTALAFWPVYLPGSR